MLMKNSVHRKELISEIRSLSRSQGMNTVFTTFLEITANSIASQTDPENAEKREQRYQEMVSTMSPKLLSSYARMLALLFLTAREYRDDPCDILGGNLSRTESEQRVGRAILHAGRYLPAHGTNHASIGRAFSQGRSDYH